MLLYSCKTVQYAQIANRPTNVMAVNAVRFVVLSCLLVAILHTCEARKCPGGPNDIPTTCASHCPFTCENPYPRPCILSCNLNVQCECREGFYRRSDGMCVTQRGCKQGPGFKK